MGIDTARKVWYYLFRSWDWQPHRSDQAKDASKGSPFAGTAPLPRGCQPQCIKLPGAVAARGFSRIREAT